MRLFWPFVTAILVLLLAAIFLFPKQIVQIFGNLFPNTFVTASRPEPEPAALPTFHGPTGQPFIQGPSAPPPTSTASVATLTNKTILTKNILVDLSSAAKIQKAVDDGHEPWRLDPLSVAEVEGQNDFRISCAMNKGNKNPCDTYSLETRDKGQAVVTVTRDTQAWGKIELRQPIHQDTKGIWVVTKIEQFQPGS